MEENKTELRKSLRKKRIALSEGSAGSLRMQRIQQQLLGSRLWNECLRVVLYVSVKGEADTSLLLNQAWHEGKEVFLPRCRPQESGYMDMLYCSSRDKLEVSSMGIPEPRAEKNVRVLSLGELQAGADTLIIVPALAFDHQGYRLGYGGGYYDRMLANARCRSAGLCFGALFFPSLPHDVWDIPVAYVCTEEKLHCLQV